MSIPVPPFPSVPFVLEFTFTFAFPFILPWSIGGVGPCCPFLWPAPRRCSLPRMVLALLFSCSTERGEKPDYGIITFELDDSTKPVYHSVKGWNQDLPSVRNEKDFPEALKNYISYLEKELETPISIVSVGPKRSETIIR